MKRCHKCGAEWAAEKKQPGVKEFCDRCSAYLHCCRNCKHYDPSKHNLCHIPTTDWVGDREGANFCDEFDFVDTAQAGASDPKANPARDALTSLFGDLDSVHHPEGRDAFDHLFGD